MKTRLLSFPNAQLVPTPLPCSALWNSSHQLLRSFLLVNIFLQCCALNTQTKPSDPGDGGAQSELLELTYSADVTGNYSCVSELSPWWKALLDKGLSSWCFQDEACKFGRFLLLQINNANSKRRFSNSFTGNWLKIDLFSRTEKALHH